MKKIEFKEYVKNLPNFLNTDEEQLYFVYGDKSYVLSNGSEFNEQYCIDNNIEVIRTEHNGGTIVSSIDDIYVGFITPHSNDFGTRIFHAFLEFLKNKGLNANYNGNDILIDETYKVAANSKIKTNYKYYTAVGFFGTADIETIKNVCVKPMNKIPKGLNEFGVTKEDVENFINNFINIGKE